MFLHVACTLTVTNYRALKVFVKTRNIMTLTSKLPHDKINKMTCAPSEDSDQPGLSSLSTWRNIGPLTTYWVHSEDSDWADAQADLLLRKLHVILFALSCGGTSNDINKKSKQPGSAHLISRKGRCLLHMCSKGNFQDELFLLTVHHLQMNFSVDASDADSDTSSLFG